MKPLIVLLRITLVGILWSILFIEGVRVILLTNWHFDIFRLLHWRHAWNLWISGWVIDQPKEWAFILIILTAIPVWATVWAALSIIKWENLFRSLLNWLKNLLTDIASLPVKEISKPQPVTKVVKKKSYKEVRPANPHAPVNDSASTFDAQKRAQLAGIPYKPQPMTARPQPVASVQPQEFSHSLFELDTPDDNVDFDLFAEPEVPEKNEQETVSNTENYSRNERNNSSNKKRKSDNRDNSRNQSPSAEKGNKTYHTNSTFELLKQKGYEIISGVTLQDTMIDFVGISKHHICLCLNDKEPGDWLADEERFNDEEPLWFSESSHRISPVRKVAIARDSLAEKLSSRDLHFEIKPFVIEQIGNIINAEDMFDIWKDLNINVTRIDRGTPKEIPLFAKKLEDAEPGIDKDTLDKLKKLLRSNE